jgi:hypothetical protein
VDGTGDLETSQEGEMKSLVVYESFYGNTQAIAEAVSEGLGRHGQARAVSVGDADPQVLNTVDLLVVGAPTHAWGLPRAKTRASVQSSGADETKPLVRDWLGEIPAGAGRPAVAFATRFDKPRLLTGSAARTITRRLHRAGWSSASEPMSFFVTASSGPLEDGEIAKAKAWGDHLGAQLAPTPAPS